MQPKIKRMRNISRKGKDNYLYFNGSITKFIKNVEFSNFTFQLDVNYVPMKEIEN